jgi:hypothetical protein
VKREKANLEILIEDILMKSKLSRVELHLKMNDPNVFEMYCTSKHVLDCLETIASYIKEFSFASRWIKFVSNEFAFRIRIRLYYT